MKPVFVDTMGWYSLFDRRDSWHSSVGALLKNLAGRKIPLLTTDYVVDETATLLMVRGASRALDAFFEMLEESSALTALCPPKPTPARLACLTRVDSTIKVRNIYSKSYTPQSHPLAAP